MLPTFGGPICGPSAQVDVVRRFGDRVTDVGMPPAPTRSKVAPRLCSSAIARTLVVPYAPHIGDRSRCHVRGSIAPRKHPPAIAREPRGFASRVPRVVGTALYRRRDAPKRNNIGEGLTLSAKSPLGVVGSV